MRLLLFHWCPSEFEILLVRALLMKRQTDKRELAMSPEIRRLRNEVVNIIIIIIIILLIFIIIIIV